MSRSGSQKAKRAARGSGDEGFSLTEALVAGLVLAIFAAAVSGVLVKSIQVSQSSRERIAASSLAAREMEIVRDRFQRIDTTAGNSNTFAKALVDAGLVTNPNALKNDQNVVDGVAYTISRSAYWEPKGTGVSACDGGNAVNFPSVHLSVTVRWPKMGGTAPIKSETVLTPNKTLLSTAYSFAAVKVQNFAGQPNPGRTVTADGPSGTSTQRTDSSGCAVFGIATPGGYTFHLGEPGFVDFLGNATPTKPATISSGAFQQIQFTYDLSGQMDVKITAPGGYALPTTLPTVNVGNQSLPSPGLVSYTPTGVTTSLTGLGPYANGFTVWAGGCADSNPSGPPTSGSLVPIVVAPGGYVTAAAMLGAVDVVTHRPGVVVSARKTSVTCPAGEDVLTLGVTNGAGDLATSVPYGSWLITTSDGGTSPLFHPTQVGSAEVVVP